MDDNELEGTVVFEGVVGNMKWFVILADNGKHYGAGADSFYSTKRKLLKIFKGTRVIIKSIKDNRKRIADLVEVTN